MSRVDLDGMVSVITPEIYQSFKTAVELRRWANGVAMTKDQIEICLQAMITYEHHHLPVHERTGYVPPKTQACADDGHIHTHEIPLKWQDE